jgi:hypothetical protein
MASMNITWDIVERETGLPLDNREYPQDVISDFTAGAAWARGEALREAAGRIERQAPEMGRGINITQYREGLNDGVARALTAVLRALAEGDSNE